MPLLWIIVIAVVALVLLVVISYMFRDSFLLFEGIYVIFDAIGQGIFSIDFDGFDGGDGGD